MNFAWCESLARIIAAGNEPDPVDSLASRGYFSRPDWQGFPQMAFLNSLSIRGCAEAGGATPYRTGILDHGES